MFGPFPPSASFARTHTPRSLTSRLLHLQPRIGKQQPCAWRTGTLTPPGGIPAHRTSILLTIPTRRSHSWRWQGPGQGCHSRSTRGRSPWRGAPRRAHSPCGRRRGRSWRAAPLNISSHPADLPRQRPCPTSSHRPRTPWRRRWPGHPQCWPDQRARSFVGIQTRPGSRCLGAGKPLLLVCAHALQLTPPS